eukprot:35735-Amphidinium_carterae.1
MPSIANLAVLSCQPLAERLGLESPKKAGRPSKKTRYEMLYTMISRNMCSWLYECVPTIRPNDNATIEGGHLLTSECRLCRRHHGNIKSGFAQRTKASAAWMG